MEGFVSHLKKNYRDRAIHYEEEHCPPSQSGELMRLKLVVKKRGEHFYACWLQSMGVQNVKQNPIAYGNLFKCGKTPVRKVLIEGSAGIGKTSLCMSVSKDWANGKLFQEYEMLLLLPLHQEAIALAGSLPELIEGFMSQVNSQSVASYLEERKGEGVLIVADGWNKFDESKRQKGSFLYNLLFGDVLDLASVIVTSRHSASAPLHRDSNIDPLFVEICGFSKESIRGYIQSEFTSSQQATDHLLEQLQYNPLIESICSVPLTCSMICHLCHLEKTLPATMTELCTKLTFSIIDRCIQKTDTSMSDSISVHEINALPEHLQEPLWHICQLAFKAIHTNQIDNSELQPAKLCFGIESVALVDYVTEDKLSSINFLHPTFQEYLAALHLVKQPPELQLKAMEMIRSKQLTYFWRYLFGHCIEYDQMNILKHAIQALSTDAHSRALLCHCAFEARTESITKDVIKALTVRYKTCSNIHLGDPCTAYDCESIMYVIDNMQGSECDGIIINFSACSLGEKQVIKLTDVLCKSIVHVRDLDMSGNDLSDDIVAHLFHRAFTAFQSLEKLFLRNNKIGINGISAIMVALSKSSRNVIVLDLSFNPLTITGLQVLQDGVCSKYLVNLEVLFLQGSLTTADADINLQYLIKLAEALLLHCPHLQRLDLSSNDLGDPETSDIRIVTSQLIGKNKKLDLRLNREYMAEVDNNFITVMEESVRQKGTINHTIAHGIFVGPGRSGKNSLMNRLMGEAPPDSDKISPSTGALESIVKVEVKKMCTVAAAVSNLIWKRLNYDEEACELMMTTVRCHTSSDKDSSSTDNPSTSADVENGSEDTKSSPTSSANENARGLLKGRCVADTEIETQSGKLGINPSRDIVHKKPLDIFNYAVELRRMDKLREHLESSWSLYLTNTGGQMEFQELLPVLACGPSIFIITFPLDKNLQEHYTVKYQHPNGKEESYESPSTLMDEILQTLATIAALDKYGKNSKPKIFFVGTHKDQLPESSADSIIQMTDKLLQEKVRQTSLFSEQGSIEFAIYPDRLIFAVNNLDKEDTEFQKIRSALQQAVDRCEEFTVQCPSSWLVFSLVLRAKHKSSQVISYNDCLTIAQNCGIRDRIELDSALSFIHSRLGLVRFFDIERLKNLVVIDPQILFDTITKLLVDTFVPSYAKVNEIEEFKKRGIFSEKSLKRINNTECQFNKKIPSDWLLCLLNHLSIAATFRDRKGEIQYFFPCVLCHAPPRQLPNPPSSYPINVPSLQIGFDSGFCPRGISTALIKYLMMNEMKSQVTWELHSTRVFRNQASFAVGPCDIILKIFPTHLEIHFDPESGTFAVNEINLTCAEALIQVKQAMEIVTKRYHECKYYFAFSCTVPGCDARPHPAKIQGNVEKVLCKKTERRGILPDGFKLWIPSQKGGSYEERLGMIIDSENGGVPKHLGKIADSMYEWEGKVAEELKLSQADVAAIKTKNSSNLRLQITEALQMWKQRCGSEATYSNLIDVFKRANYQDYANSVRKLVSQPPSNPVSECCTKIFELQQKDDNSNSDDSEQFYTPPSSPTPDSEPLFNLERIPQTREDSNTTLLYFPALCETERKESIQTPDDYDYSIGWYVKCIGEFDYLPPRFLHVLLLRLAHSFALPAACDHTSQDATTATLHLYNRRCTMWKNGIHWLMTKGVECFVENVNNSKGIIIIAKSEKVRKLVCTDMLFEIIREVHQAKKEFCDTVTLQEYYVDSDDPASFVDEEKLFHAKDIAKELKDGNPVIVSTDSQGCTQLSTERVSHLIEYIHWDAEKAQWTLAPKPKEDDSEATPVTEPERREVTKLYENSHSVLYQKLVEHCAKWREIGTHLGFRPSELDEIQSRPILYTTAPKSLLSAMLADWLQWAPGDQRGSTECATLEGLSDALDKAKLSEAARLITTVHVTLEAAV